MSPLAKVLHMIAELEGTNPKPLRVHLRRLRILGWIVYRRLAYFIALSLAMTGAGTLLAATFQLENQAVPLLTGLLQIGVAAVIYWEQLQFDTDG